jgi:hypothetical protein
MSMFTVMVIDFMLEVLLFLAIVVVIYNIYLRHRLHTATQWEVVR